MHFEGSFTVPGKAEDVIRRFADVPRMVRCMPGAVLEPPAEDGSWPGAMVVTFGPKKANFTGGVTTAFDFDALTGSLHGRGSADMRAARIGVRVGFGLRNDPAAEAATTIVDIVSDAELGGVLADFARTGGVAVANVIMADFAKRAAAEFAQDEVAVAEAPPSAPLAGGSLIWVVISAQFARFLVVAGDWALGSRDTVTAGRANTGVRTDPGTTLRANFEGGKPGTEHDHAERNVRRSKVALFADCT